MPISLLTPLRLGAFELAHRMVLPALASAHPALPGGAPTAAMVAHYARQASAGGLLIAEASAAAVRTDRTMPGLHCAEQVNAWRRLTEAVHDRGGLILVQLSLGAAAAWSAWTADADPLDAVLRTLRDAAEHAGDAGFDGVELLAASDSLPAALLGRDGPWGNEGPALVEAMLETLTATWGAARVGLCLNAADRIAPLAWPQSRQLAFVHLMNDGTAMALLRGGFAGALLGSGGLTPATAAAALAAGWVDAVGLGPGFSIDPGRL